LLLKYLVDETVLDVNSAGIGSFKIAYELLVGGWILKRIDG
jgi:hypothetical protein